MQIVDAFGPVGIEGVFRLTCEHTARVLRANKRMLMTQMQVRVVVSRRFFSDACENSPLQAFIDDPLISLADHFAATEERLASMGSRAASGGVTAQFARPLATQKYKSGPLINKDKVQHLCTRPYCYNSFHSRLQPTAAQLLNIARVLIEQCEQKLSGAVILEHWAERPTTVHMSVPAQIDALIHESKEPKVRLVCASGNLSPRCHCRSWRKCTMAGRPGCEQSVWIDSTTLPSRWKLILSPVISHRRF